MNHPHHSPWPGVIAQFERWLRFRLDQYFSGNPPDDSMPPPAWPAQYPLAQPPDASETVALLTALAPQLQPDFFDAIIRTYLPKGGDFPEFGGVKGTNARCTLPTGETVLFLLAGRDISQRMAAAVLLQPEHWLLTTPLLTLENMPDGEPRYSGRLAVVPDVADEWLLGRAVPPVFGPDFPAKAVETRQTWKDLVLPESTLQQLEFLDTWLRFHQVVAQDEVMGRKIKPGFRALFYGPSGTGKTLAATLLAKRFDKTLYRIDLSQVVSKYIGETEKNLEKVFSRAQARNWVLFFDEADALFGKRSQVQSAHDKYANQEVSYLLQRVEDYPGLVILASNFKSNIDQAFLRRFNAIIEFPMPSAAERRQLWEKVKPRSMKLAPGTDLDALAARHELTGSGIVQAMHFACLMMKQRGLKTINTELLTEGIQAEIKKEGKLHIS